MNPTFAFERRLDGSLERAQIQILESHLKRLPNLEEAFCHEWQNGVLNIFAWAITDSVNRTGEPCKLVQRICIMSKDDYSVNVAYDTNRSVHKQGKVDAIKIMKGRKINPVLQRLLSNFRALDFYPELPGCDIDMARNLKNFPAFAVRYL